MIFRSALMISAPVYEEEAVHKLVASPEQFEELKTVLNDSRIGGFGRLTPITNSDCSTSLQEIERFFEKRESHELLLLYLTGYELVNFNGKIYFTDQNSDPENIAATSLSAKKLQSIVKDCNANLKVLIIDCFSREELTQKEMAEKGKRLTSFSSKSKSYVLTSQDTVGTALRADGTPNPGFTESMLMGLKSGDADIDKRGHITIDELFLYTYKRMSENGPTPNLFVSSPKRMEGVRIARNISFEKLQKYNKKDDVINMGRFFKLVAQKKTLTTGKEKQTFKKVIDSQPEITFLKRMGASALSSVIVSSLLGLLLAVPLSSAIIIGIGTMAALVTLSIADRWLN